MEENDNVLHSLCTYMAQKKLVYGNHESDLAHSMSVCYFSWSIREFTRSQNQRKASGFGKLASDCPQLFCD